MKDIYKAHNKPWTRDEFILTLSLYFQLPFGKLSHRTPEVVELAKLISRTSNSIALRLANFAACDPSILSTGRHGMNGGGKSCIEYWKMYEDDKETLFYEAEKIKAKLQCKTIESSLSDFQLTEIKYYEGKDREQLVKTRVNQNIFRSMILANYQNTCAISGLNIPDLLVASHIIPWAKNKKERLNPENGICLSTLYHSAFDNGLITIDPDYYTIILSEKLSKYSGEDYFDTYFNSISGKKIILPKEHIPNKSFLKDHNTFIFKR